MIAIGQHQKGVSAGVPTVSSTAVNTTHGSTFEACIIWDTVANFVRITDNFNNEWKLVGSEQAFNAGGASPGKARKYRCENGTGGNNHVVTAEVSTGSGVAMTIFFVEILGQQTPSAFDVAAQINDTASPFTVSSPPTAQERELAIAFLAGNAATSGSTHSGAPDFTVIEEETNGIISWTGCIATKELTVKGAVTPSLTEVNGTDSAVFVSTFKEFAEVTVAADGPGLWIGAPYSFIGEAAIGAREFGPGQSGEYGGGLVIGSPYSLIGDSQIGAPDFVPGASLGPGLMIGAPYSFIGEAAIGAPEFVPGASLGFGAVVGSPLSFIGEAAIGAPDAIAALVTGGKPWLWRRRGGVIKRGSV